MLLAFVMSCPVAENEKFSFVQIGWTLKSRIFGQLGQESGGKWKKGREKNEKNKI